VGCLKFLVIVGGLILVELTNKLLKDLLSIPIKIEKTLQLRKPPKTFVSALAKHIFFHLEHFVQFDEAIAISNEIAISQWAEEAIEIKKNIFANLSININTEN